MFERGFSSHSLIPLLKIFEKKMKTSILIYTLAILYLASTPSIAGQTFFYKAEILDMTGEIGTGTTVRVNIPDLISGITIVYDKNQNPTRINWSGTRGISLLHNVVQQGMSPVFPKTNKPDSIVMIGINRPKDFINLGQWHFNNVEWHGFIEVIDEVETEFIESGKRVLGPDH